jgi:hypothetical protein
MGDLPLSTKGERTLKLTVSAVCDGDGVGVGDGVGEGEGLADALGDGVGVALGVGDALGDGEADALGDGEGDPEAVAVGDALGDADGQAGTDTVTGKPVASLTVIWSCAANVNVRLVTLLTRPPGAEQSEAVTVSVGADVSAVPGAAGLAVASVLNVAWVHSIVTLMPNGSKMSVRSVPDCSPASSTSAAETLDPPALPVVSTSVDGDDNAAAVTAIAVMAATAPPAATM